MYMCSICLKPIPPGEEVKLRVVCPVCKTRITVYIHRGCIGCGREG